MCEYIEWISVNDHMPEDDLPNDSKRVDIRVLTCTAGKNGSVKTRVRTRYYYSDQSKQKNKKWSWCGREKEPTHWAYLPKAAPFWSMI